MADAFPSAPERTSSPSVIERSLSGESFGSRPLTVETAGAGTGALPEGDTLDRVVAIVRRELETTRAPKCFPDLAGETRFERDLLCSTIDLVCIADEIERAFGVDLPERPLDACATIGDLAALVAAVRKKEPGL